MSCQLIDLQTGSIIRLLTNIPLCDQYVSIQNEHMETWQAFKRRIKKVIHYADDGQINESDPNDVINSFKPVDSNEAHLVFN